MSEGIVDWGPHKESLRVLYVAAKKLSNILVSSENAKCTFRLLLGKYDRLT